MGGLETVKRTQRSSGDAHAAAGCKTLVVVITRQDVVEVHAVRVLETTHTHTGSAHTHTTTEQLCVCAHLFDHVLSNTPQLGGALKLALLHGSLNFLR